VTAATPHRESSFERVVSAVILVVFWTAFAALASGLTLWLVRPTNDAGMLALAGGLLGLLLLPLLRVIWALAAGLARRDWLMLGAAATVLAILMALTLRDAASLGG
jgi:uncharacterized membrane protein YjfL (UPF0719 family)